MIISDINNVNCAESFGLRQLVCTVYYFYWHKFDCFYWTYLFIDIFRKFCWNQKVYDSLGYNLKSSRYISAPWSRQQSNNGGKQISNYRGKMSFLNRNQYDQSVLIIAIHIQKRFRGSKKTVLIFLLNICFILHTFKRA